MFRPLPWFWIVLALLLLLPGPAGRVLLDLVGGITLTLVLLPLLAGGAAWIGWQWLRSRLTICPACGTSSLSSDLCPACGTPLHDSPGSSPVRETSSAAELDARDLTITVEAVEVPQADPQSPQSPAPPR